MGEGLFRRGRAFFGGGGGVFRGGGKGIWGGGGGFLIESGF